MVSIERAGHAGPRVERDACNQAAVVIPAPGVGFELGRAVCAGTPVAVGVGAIVRGTAAVTTVAVTSADSDGAKVTKGDASAVFNAVAFAVAAAAGVGLISPGIGTAPAATARPPTLAASGSRSSDNVRAPATAAHSKRSHICAVRCMVMTSPPLPLVFPDAPRALRIFLKGKRLLKATRFRAIPPKLESAAHVPGFVVAMVATAAARSTCCFCAWLAKPWVVFCQWWGRTISSYKAMYAATLCKIQ